MVSAQQTDLLPKNALQNDAIFATTSQYLSPMVAQSPWYIITIYTWQVSCTKTNPGDEFPTGGRTVTYFGTEQLVSDNMPPFLSEEIGCFWKFHGIKHIRTYVCHHITLCPMV